MIPAFSWAISAKSAQDLGVGQADAGDDAHRRIDHVRRIPPSAEAGLDHSDLHARRGEVLECQRRPGVEGRGRAGARSAASLEMGPHRRKGSLEFGVAGRLAVDGDSLVEAFQMRFGEKACPQARRLAGGGDHRSDGAFAGGAGDVHHGVAALGMAGRFHQKADAVQRGPAAAGLQAAEVREKCALAHDDSCSNSAR